MGTPGSGRAGAHHAQARAGHAPRSRESRFKHLELINLRDTLVLLVLVLMGGTVKQQMLTLDQPVEQDTLSRISNLLNDQFRGFSARQIHQATSELSDLGQQVARIVEQVISSVDQQDEAPVYREGLVHLLGEPEFADDGQVRGLVRTLEGPSLAGIVATAAQPLEIGGVQVLIGGEGRWEEFSDLALVLSRVRRGGRGQWPAGCRRSAANDLRSHHRRGALRLPANERSGGRLVRYGYC